MSIKYTKISTHFQQLLATAGGVKSQRCTRSHSFSTAQGHSLPEYRTRKIDFPPSSGTTSHRLSRKPHPLWRVWFARLLTPAAFYEGIVSRYTASESLWLRTETCFVMFVRRVKIKWRVIYSVTPRTRTRAVSMHAGPLLAPPPCKTKLCNDLTKLGIKHFHM